MNDTITRQAAIDAALEDVSGKRTHDFNAGATRAANRIKRLPSAQQHWIPCGERLPEERGFYLTTTKDKAVYCDYWNEDNFDRTEMVIAWMPLPEPYKEDKDA